MVWEPEAELRSRIMRTIDRPCEHTRSFTNMFTAEYGDLQTVLVYLVWREN